MRMETGKFVVAALIGAVCGVVPLPACGDTADMVWRHLPQFQLDYTRKSEFLDLDGDGVNEIVLAGAQGEIGVLQQDDSGLSLVDIHWVDRLSGHLVAVPGDGDGPAKLIVGSADGETGRLTELTGVPLRVTRQMSLDFPVRPWAYGDIDNDGEPEILEFNPNQSSPAVRVLDSATGVVEWALPMDGVAATSAAAMPLHDNAPWQIIVGGSTPGLILSGLDGSLEWSHPAGFGHEVYAGRFHDDPTIRTFATKGSSVQVFRAQPFARLTEFSVSAIPTQGLGTVHDVNGDGVDDLLVAPYFISTNIQAFDMRSGLMTGSWPSYFSNSTVLGFGRIQSGTESLLAHGSPAGIGAAPYGVEVRSFPDSDTRYRVDSRQGPYNQLAAADVDGDGHEEIVLASGVRAGFLSFTPELMVFSGGSEPDVSRRFEDLRWQTGFDDEFLVTVADLDGNHSEEIVVAGQRGAASVVIALDGATLEAIWEREATDQSDLAGFTHVALSSADTDGDGIPDVVLLVRDFEFGHRVVTLSGLTGETLWTSLAMPGMVSSKSLLVAQIDADPVMEIIVTASLNMHVFDAISKELQRTLVIDSGGATSAVVIGQAPNCQLAVVEPPLVRRFNCQNNAFRGASTLPSGVDWVWQVDADSRTLLAANGDRLFVLKPTEGGYFHSPVSGSIGARLSAVPDHMISATSPGGGLIDVMVSTGGFPAKLRVDLDDPLWRDGFEQQ